MSTATIKTSFAKLNRKTSPANGGQIRLRENYLREDLLLPHFLQEDCFFILPTSSSLDLHLETILSCGEPTSKAVVLGSVLARLKMLGYLKTLQRVKKVVLHDPTRSWLGLADDHLPATYISTSNGDDEPGLMKTTLRFLFEWFPQAQFCVLSETGEFRDEMSVMFPELSILSVKQFCALYCPNVHVEEKVENSISRSSLLQAANGRRKSGKLRCVNSKLAFVGMDCLVVQRSRAIHGDTVEIEPCNNEGAGNDDDDDVEVNPNKFTTKYQVVAIVKRDDHRRNLVCTLDVNEEGESHTANLVCVPMDQRCPKLIIPHSKLARTLAGKRFLVEVLDWPENCRYPNARYLRTIGAVGEVATESSCILIETGLAAHDLPFSVQALQELPCNFEFKLTPNEMDLRSRRVVSIDPIGCQDIDDAISLERSLDGDGSECFELAVHIADVDRFVRSGGALDREASARATSVYLEERRLDMLPSLLCENLCSLRPQTDRFAVSVLWKVDLRTLQVCSPPKFTKSMIHSRYALAYEQAQNLADGKPAGEYLSQRARGWTGGEVKQEDCIWLTETIRTLMGIARKREQQRITSGGAINLSNDREEVSFKPVQVANADTVANNAEAIKLNSCEHLEIHNTIAELMILANEAVARHLLEICPSRALLRMHPPSSDPIKFQSCVEFCAQLGIKFDYSSNRTIAASLDLVRAKCDRATAQYVESLTTRAMSEAQYVCAGTTTNATTAGSKYSAYFHFGLGLEAYTHFTSPIRRYADLVVARQIFDVPAPVPQQVAPPAAKPAVTVVASAVQEDEEEDLSWANALGGGGSSDEESDREVFQVIQPVFTAAPLPPPVVLEPQFKPALEQHTHSSTQTVQAICDHINVQHRAAKEASYKSTELFLSLFLRSSSQEQQRYLGLLSSIRVDSGMVVFFVPTFDLKVPIKLVTRGGVFDRDTVVIAVTDKISTMSLADEEVTFTIANSDKKLSYKLRDQVELELFVEEKDVSAPRMPQVQARLVIASAAATTPAAAKPFTAMLESLKPHQQEEELKRVVTISNLFAQARKLRPRSRPTAMSSSIPTMMLPGVRSCFGDFVPPKPALAFSPATAQADEHEEEEEEQMEIDFSRHYMSTMSASAVTKTQVQQLEREATRRIAKLQAEKFESRTKRRMKKGD